MPYTEYLIEVHTGFVSCVHEKTYHPNEVFSEEIWGAMSEEEQGAHLSEVADDFAQQSISVRFAPAED
jgi:hypothetical protein